MFVRSLTISLRPLLYPIMSVTILYVLSNSTKHHYPPQKTQISVVSLTAMFRPTKPCGLLSGKPPSFSSLCREK